MIPNEYISRECQWCGAGIRRGKYCPRFCFANSRRGIPRTAETKKKIGDSTRGEWVPVKCGTCLTEFKSPVYLQNIKKDKYCSRECYRKSQPGRTSFRKGKPFPQLRGDKHHNWKGGITPERIKDTNSYRYKTWRRAVFERDNYTCQDCGRRGGKLNADHTYPWKMYPELRYDVRNGWTMCEECHLKKTVADKFLYNNYRSTPVERPFGTAAT